MNKIQDSPNFDVFILDKVRNKFMNYSGKISLNIKLSV